MLLTEDYKHQRSVFKVSIYGIFCPFHETQKRFESLKLTRKNLLYDLTRMANFRHSKKCLHKTSKLENLSMDLCHVNAVKEFERGLSSCIKDLNYIKAFKGKTVQENLFLIMENGCNG